jgi:hypothetical protein
VALLITQLNFPGGGYWLALMRGRFNRIQMHDLAHLPSKTLMEHLLASMIG